MNPKLVKSFVLGAIAAYSFAALVLVAAAKLGLLPVQADVVPSKLEARLVGSALHAAVARHASGKTNPMPAFARKPDRGCKSLSADVFALPWRIPRIGQHLWPIILSTRSTTSTHPNAV